MPAPALKTQLAVFALPTGAGILPVLLAHRSLDGSLHPFGQPQLEQIGLTALLGLAHHRLIAKTGIATDQPRTLLGRQAIHQLPEAARSMLGGMFVAGSHL